MTEYEYANHIRLQSKVSNHRFGYHPTVPGAIQRNILKTRLVQQPQKQKLQED
jgi:hypothetical protein